MVCGGLLAVVGAAGAAGDDAGDRIVMETAVGEIEIEIYEQQAPVTADNFLRLADGGHLDGATFYRTVSPSNDNGSPVISVIQGGLGEAPSPFSPIAHETTRETGLAHLDGTISMARAEVGTASSEFFICIGDQPALDFGGARNSDGQGFAAFGRVVRGMNVVRRIHSLPANAPTDSDYVKGQLLDDQVTILSVRRL
jgi:peptidyl-prolyl cis-trans isomerase A (cyclophilin A)